MGVTKLHLMARLPKEAGEKTKQFKPCPKFTPMIRRKAPFCFNIAPESYLNMLAFSALGITEHKVLSVVNYPGPRNKSKAKPEDDGLIWFQSKTKVVGMK